MTDLAFSPDNQRLAASSSDGTIQVWTVATRHELFALRGHLGPVNSVCFSSDGKRIASASSDRTVKLWDSRSGKEIWTFRGQKAGMGGIAFSPDGKNLAAVNGPTITIWSIEEPRVASGSLADQLKARAITESESSPRQPSIPSRDRP